MTPISVVTIEPATASNALRRALQHDGDIDVVSVVQVPEQAAEVVARHHPAMIVIDVDGDDRMMGVVQELMATTPTPIIVVSSPEFAVSTVISEALGAGALEALPRPEQSGDATGATLRQRVRVLSQVVVLRRRRKSPPATPGRKEQAGEVPVIAIAASTGGPPAVATVFAGLHGISAAILIVQHMHTQFLPGFVSWLAGSSEMHVVMAEKGSALTSGKVFVAPGGQHLRIDSNRKISLSDQPDALHRPSANELFASVAQQISRRAVGVILTGMGDDGADGLAAMRRAGAFTIAQDETTSAVFGMPRAAIAKQGVSTVLPLQQISAAIVSAVQRMPK